ncbi:MAG: UDP-N-acetylmuramate dehydrogenase [Bacteroidota bacterium]|nr:UDP-N-acetylmuramate dehydrogenase [Bacteroidota bacterium]
MISVQEHIRLSDYTTLHLGGMARYFYECTSIDDLRSAILFAREKGLRYHILGGGSNTIFADKGFDGLVMKIGLRGISFVHDGNDILVSTKAGEDWESFVAMSVEKGFAGIECLSGIPGLVGATPIQNVGAYGQEVKDTIESVKVLEKETFEEKIFQNSECKFSYRESRFKQSDAGKYIVTEVVFRLKKNGRPSTHYPEVQKMIERTVPLSSLADGIESLSAVRNIVLSLRKKKSMVIDPNDSNTRSVGSFFLNPIVDKKTLSAIIDHWKVIGDGTTVPTFPFGEKQKISAAWLIERSGFKKGYKKNDVGISENHTLALVNYHGTTTALLLLAEEIQMGVEKVFNIRLQLEANVIS